MIGAKSASVNVLTNMMSGWYTLKLGKRENKIKHNQARYDKKVLLLVIPNTPRRPGKIKKS